MLDAATLKARINDLVQQKTRAAAAVQQIEGAIKFAITLLDEIQKPAANGEAAPESADPPAATTG